MKKADLPQMGKKRKKSHFAEVITKSKPVFDPRECRSDRLPFPSTAQWRVAFNVCLPSVCVQRRRALSSTWTSTTSWTMRTSSTTSRAGSATDRFFPTTLAWPQTRWAARTLSTRSQSFGFRLQFVSSSNLWQSGLIYTLTSFRTLALWQLSCHPLQKQLLPRLSLSNPKKVFFLVCFV